MTSEKVPSLVDLAEQILAEARKIEAAIPAPPDFQNDTLEHLPAEYESSRLSLIDKAELMNELVRGSSGVYGRTMRIAATQYMDEIALHFLHEYRIPQRVPLDSAKSVEELSKEISLPHHNVISILRMSALNHIFCFPDGKEDTIAHTVDSRLMATDPTTFDQLGMIRSEHRPASYRYFEALEKWKDEEGSGKAAWNLANDTDMGLYAWLSQPDQGPERKERLRQLGSAMTNLTKHGLRGVQLIGKAWPWDQLPQGSTVVDVGGGNGHISIGLASQFPSLNFIVQDTKDVVGKGVGEQIPEELKPRITYMVHDFFTEQPIKDANVFFLANIVHNWSDSDATKILRNLIPALKPGARVLICDRLIPDYGTEYRVAEKEINSLNLMMDFLFHAKERTAAETRELLQGAGAFEWGGVYAVPNGLYKICEGIWKG